VCTVCPSTCLTCKSTKSGLNCTACKPTYSVKIVNNLATCICTSTQSEIPSAGGCVNCSTSLGCKTCTYSSSVVCTSCVTNAFLTTPTCTACMPVCYNCSTTTTCIVCLNNLVLSTGSCNCPALTFLNPLTLTCQSCALLQPNCNICGYQSGSYNMTVPSAVICLEAAPRFYILPNGSTDACMQYC
jgi:hypothetical protein